MNQIDRKQAILQNEISSSYGYIQSKMREERREQVRKRTFESKFGGWASRSCYTDISGRGNYICQDREEGRESPGCVLSSRDIWRCLEGKCVGGAGDGMVGDNDLGCHAGQLFIAKALSTIGVFKLGVTSSNLHFRWMDEQDWWKGTGKES